MKLIDSVKNIKEAAALLEELENPEYLEANGITEEEVSAFKEDLTKQIQSDKEQILWLAEYFLKKRNEDNALAIGTKAQVDALTKTQKYYENQVKKREGSLVWIASLLNTKEIKTTVGRVIVTQWNRMVVGKDSIDALPETLIKFSVTGDLDADKVEEMKNIFGLEAKKDRVDLDTIKAWYDGLDDKTKEEMKLKGIYIDNGPNVTIK